MRSMRRTLVVTLVGLFAGVLAGVAVGIDRVADRAFRDREAVVAAYVREQYDDRCREDLEKRDQQLLFEARALAGQMQSKYAGLFEQESANFRRKFTLSEQMWAMSPTAPLVHSTVSIANVRWAVFIPAARAYYNNLHLDDDLLTKPLHRKEDDGRDDGPYPPLYQVNISSWSGSVWKLKSQTRAFPLGPTTVDSAELVNEKYDVLNVDGKPYRRVVFQSGIYLPWLRMQAQPRGNRPPGGGGDRPPGDRPPGTRPPDPAATPMPPDAGRAGDDYWRAFPRISVHAARPVAALDKKLAANADDRDAQLAALAGTIADARFRTRAIIGGVGLSALVVLLFGGLWLVRRGLRPLDRLSDAVSRVSEKDFRLPIGSRELPGELVPIHARLTATLDQLRRAFDREKEAVADISHELRTPVAALLTTLEVALRKPRTAEQYQATLADCRDITRQLGQLVERVMTLAYLDSGQATLATAWVDGAELAAGCAAVIRPLAEAHGLTFRLTADGPTGVNTDRDKLREVVMNLLHNAVEYNRPGGSVELCVAATPGGNVAFAVADTGIGMTAEVRGKIFDRFFRADPSRTATGVHAGLGLAIVREYVDRLGGAIRVESTPGVGSTFAVELPAAE